LPDPEDFQASAIFLISELSWGAGCLGLVEGMSLFIPGKEELPHEDLGCTCIFRLANQLKKTMKGMKRE